MVQRGIISRSSTSRLHPDRRSAHAADHFRPTEDNSELYKKVDSLIPSLVKEDFELDEKQRQVTLTEAGNEHMVELLRQVGVLEEGDLYDINNITTGPSRHQALRAHKLFPEGRD